MSSRKSFAASSPVHLREASDRGPGSGAEADRDVVGLVELGAQHDPESRGIEVVVPPLDQQLPLHRSIGKVAVGTPRRGGDASQVGVEAAVAAGGAIPVDPDVGRAIGRDQLIRIDVEDVDRGIAGQTVGVHHPEEPAALEVQVPDLPVLCLAGGLSDRIGPLRDHAALLGGGEGLELQRTEIEDGVDAEVVGGHRGRDEARGRRLEEDGADVHPANDLVLETLVVDLDVVVARVLPLGVEVHVHVDPLAQQPRGPDVHLVIERRGLETAATARGRIERKRRAALLLPGAVGSDLETGRPVQLQIRVLGRHPEQRLALHPLLFAQLDFGNGDAVKQGEPLGHGPVGAVPGHRRGDGAVERRDIRCGRESRRPHPGSPERGRLLQRERRLVESEVNPRSRRVRLCGENPGQRENAAQGDQVPYHSIGSGRSWVKVDRTNIVVTTNAYNRLS